MRNLARIFCLLLAALPAQANEFCPEHVRRDLRCPQANDFLQQNLQKGNLLCRWQQRSPALQRPLESLPDPDGNCTLSSVGLDESGNLEDATHLGEWLLQSLFLRDTDRLVQNYTELLLRNHDADAACKTGLKKLLDEARALAKLPPRDMSALAAKLSAEVKKNEAAALPPPRAPIALIRTEQQQITQPQISVNPAPPDLETSSMPGGSEAAEPRAEFRAPASINFAVHEPQPTESSAAWPPACAVSAFVSDMEQKRERHFERGWIGRQLHSLVGDGPPRMENIREQPSLVFLTLTDEEQSKYLSNCDPERLLASVAQMSYVPPPFHPVQVAPDPEWPPACALDSVRTIAEHAKRDHEARTWLGRLWNRMNGHPDGEVVEKMIRDPRAAFFDLGEEQKQVFLAGCVPPPPGLSMPARDPAQFPLANVAPLAAWPPACAVDAFKRDLDALQAHAQKEGWLERNLREAAQAPIPRSLQSMLRDPASSFVVLAPEAQAGYLNSCSPASMRKPADPPGFFGRIRESLLGMGVGGKLLLVLAAAVGGALLWRVRGGFLPTGSTQLARLIGTLPLALLGGLLGGPWGFAAGAAMFLTTALIGWGSVYQTRNAGEAAAMTLRGLWQTALPGALLAQKPGNSPYYSLTGLGMGPIYLASNTLAGGMQMGARAGFITGSTDLAELGTGALLYGAFAAVLLFGGDPNVPMAPLLQQLR